MRITRITMTGRNDFSAVDITAIIQTAIGPLINKIQTLEEKVDRLGQDRITRSDMDKLTITFVQRDAYETRHAVVVDQARQMETDIRELRKMCEGMATRTSEQLEVQRKQIEERFKQQQETTLSDKDRSWIRLSIASGWLATLITIVTFLLTHIKFTN